MVGGNSMKVIFVLPNLSAGGAERVVTVLAHEFTAQGIKTDIVLLMNNSIQYTLPESVKAICLNTLTMSRRERIHTLRGYFKQEKKIHNHVVVIPFYKLW